MTRRIAQIAAVSIGVAATIAALGWIWLEFDATRAVYTDADTIRTPAAHAPTRNVLWKPATRLPAPLNTDDDEYEPRISADAHTLYFVRGKAGGHADLFTAHRTPDGWSEPRPLDALNTEDHDELGPTPTPDDDAILLYSDRPHGLGGYDLWISRRGADGWRTPVNLGPGVNSPHNEYAVSLSPDASTLYFASNRPRPDELRTRGNPEDAWPSTLRESRESRDYDLYMAPLTDAGAGDAVRIDALSTPYDEGTPAVSPEGDFLYFSSDRPGGAGAFDLYRARIIDNAFRPVEHLEGAVNTPANELDPALAMGGFELLFSSDREHDARPDARPDDPADAAPPAPRRDYDLHRSLSREVYLDREPIDARIELSAILPHLLWLLLLLLLLLTLLVLRRLGRDERFRRLSLLAKCLLLSALIHMLLLAAFTAWQVSTALEGYLREPGGRRVILSSGASADALARQIRAGMTDDVDVEPAPSPSPVARIEPLAQRSPPAETFDTPDPAATRLQPRAIEQPVRAEDAADPRRPRALDRTEAPALAAIEPRAALPAPDAPAPTTRPEQSIDAGAPPVQLAAVRAAPAPAPGDEQAALIESTPAPKPARAADEQSLLAEAAIDAREASSNASEADRAPAPMTPLPPMAAASPDVALPADAARAEAAEPALNVTLPAQARARRARPASSAADEPRPAEPMLAALSPYLDVPDEFQPAANLLDFRDEEKRAEIIEQHGGSEETEQAVRRALRWLAQVQSPDGRWDGFEFENFCAACGGATRIESDVALTGLALVAFFGANHSHVEPGPYRATVERGLRWILARQNEKGDLRAGETMHSHAIAAMALAEAYAMSGDPELRPAIEAAVRFILDAHDPDKGGWRYEPGMLGDTSVLGWQIMALTSARRAGVPVGDIGFQAAERWLDMVSEDHAPGLYAYQPGMVFTPSMTAEGMFVQQLLGVDRDHPRMRQSASLLMRNLPDWDAGAPTYYWYYATLALFQHQGEPWERWNEALVEELVASQRTDGQAAGSWDPVDRWSRVGGRVYQTAICALTLEVYYRYLPLYVDPPAARAQPGRGSGAPSGKMGE